jgi:hypothetical protein
MGSLPMPHIRIAFPSRRGWVVALLLLLAPSAAVADDLYFITVYGAQRRPINQPRYTHTWVNLVHLNGCGPDVRSYRVEMFTISWLPADLEVKPAKLHTEPGRNLTHQETIAWCADNCMEIAQFGPYQICPTLYELMLIRYGKLASGTIQYRASDLLNLRKGIDEVCNCIYAVLDFEERDPAIRPITLGFGYKASAFVSRRLQPYYVNDGETYPWVSEMVGVSTYPVVRVGWQARRKNY